ncbi:MAG: hypothetical protein DMD87_04365 [Candidatus Rokuibacteriota bacterium]|nr:MAG: hypothetical protein DMD87_04365 [Candidatus Rokubacteria bacterium]
MRALQRARDRSRAAGGGSGAGRVRPRAARIRRFLTFLLLAKQYQITVDPVRLRAYNLTLKQVFDAVSANNANAGGSYIRDGQYALMVRGIGLVQSLGDLENIVVAAQKGTPVRVRDIGQVGIGHAIRFGVLGRDHEDDLVQGIVLMRKGENPAP